MNNERRKLLSEVTKIADEAESKLKFILADVEKAFVNLPESLQYSEKGTDIELAVDSLKKAIETTGELKKHLFDAMM